MRTLCLMKRAALISLLLLSLVLDMSQSNGQTGRRGAGRPSPGKRTPAVEDKQNSAQTPPKPTAAWLSAAPNPLNVSPVLSQNSGVTQIINGAAGGTLTAKGPDGTRFTLTVPKAAFAGDVKVTVTPVVSFENLPFIGGLVAAVQITPDDLLLSCTPTLVVDPPVPIPAAEQLSFAPFAYRGESKEFHLYPLETDPSRIVFRLVRFGGFGVARATESEQEVVRQRTPTDPADRVLMEIQKLNRLLRQRRLMQTAGSSRTERGRGWRFVRASLRGVTEPQGVLVLELYRNSVKFLREAYHQDVMPKLNRLNLECRSNMMIRVREALDSAYQWMRNVDLKGIRDKLTIEKLTPDERNLIIREQLSREGLVGDAWQQRYDYYQRNIGSSITEDDLDWVERDRMRREGRYSDLEIEELQREFKANRIEFEQLYGTLNRLVYDTLKRAYDKAHQCCLQEGKDFYLTMMDGAARVFAMIGAEEETSLAKRDECLCAIRSVSAGQSGTWLGEITYTERYDDEGKKTQANPNNSNLQQENSWHRKLDYNATIMLQYNFRGANVFEKDLPAQVSATGDVKYFLGYKNTGPGPGGKGCIEGNNSNETYNGALNAEPIQVRVNINPDGTYLVTYNLPCIKTSWQRTLQRFVEGDGCSPFAIKNGNETKVTPEYGDICPTQEGTQLSDGRKVGISGRIDPKNPNVLSDTATFEEPLPENPAVKRKITIKWNLSRCKAH